MSVIYVSLASLNTNFFYKLKTDILRMLAVKMLPEAVVHRCSEAATTDPLQNRRFKIFPIFSFL